MNIKKEIKCTIDAANKKIDAYTKNYRITKRQLFIRAEMSEGDYNNYTCFRKGTKKTFNLEKLQKIVNFIENPSKNRHAENVTD